MFERLLSFFAMEDPSEYEEYYENVSWKTFRVDDSIYERCYHRDLLTYTRELQHCYSQLLEERADSYLYDVAEIRERFNDAHFRRCTLEKELAIAEGKIQLLTEQLELARSWQSVTGRKGEIDERLGREVKVQEPTAAKEGTKFKSKSGNSLKENKMLAAAYHENAWTVSDIAKELNISEGSAKSYISGMKKHYTIKFAKNGKVIAFDDTFDNCEWNLGFFAQFDKYKDTGMTFEELLESGEHIVSMSSVVGA